MNTLREQPLPGSCAIVGLMLAGGAGVIIGLILGLNAYPPTAWFAMFEVGLPAAIAGAAVGFLVGCVLALVKRLRRGPQPHHS